ncbi:MAG: SprT family zinc-dependent metalloprotease [Chloroflexi bacterium]|nr:SprT family zinc-dependent metalloprotease [Chloroflexota bacterium]
MPNIVFNGEQVEYTVRHSRRAKGIIVKFSLENGLEVVYPHGRKSPAAEEVLRAKSRWIIANIRRARDENGSRFRRMYAEGELFLIRGEPMPLKLSASAGLVKPTARLSGARFEVRVPPGPTNLDRERLRDAVLRFYRELAKAYLPPRVAQLAAEYDFTYNKLRIKNQKTRWGSCSAKGNINLNLRLMMAPVDAIDYVIIHELCHLEELNHSPKFWLLVESLCPDYRKLKAWFEQNRAQLIL